MFINPQISVESQPRTYGACFMADSLTGLSVKEVNCTRGYRELFSGLDFSIQPGEILRVEGENGSGKTSLLRILAGLAQPLDGDVLWNGLPVKHPDTGYFETMLYLGHRPAIKYELTPVENLCMAKALFGSKDQNGIEEALYQIGLYGFEDIVSGNLSAGQKRRVALAQLLLTQAKVWILDEPYTSLDVAAIAFLDELFKKHVQNGGTLIITSHQPVEIEGCAYRRLLLPNSELEQVA
jgi:heme exporter protein A